MNLLELSEQEIIRRNSMEQLRQMGIEPYPAAEYVTNAFSKEIKENFKDDAEPRPVSIAGRIMSRRIMGKASFMELQDSEGRIQVYISRDDICPEENKDLYNIVFKKLLDIGDFVGIKGFVFRTQMGEISVHAQEITVLSKSLKPLPVVKYKDGVAYDGFNDPELRYRQRYVDLVVNDGVKDIFMKRAAVIKTMRTALDEAGYTEVETPILQSIPGGASARPFITHHNSLDIDLSLRIATELYLKRLIVGGFEGVYEIGKNFRNEGMDRTHNPEFTCMELYVQYKDYNWMMSFTEQLLERICIAVNGTCESVVDGKTINFKAPYNNAENALRKVLNDIGIEYTEEIGEAAFYGPKLDVNVKPAIGNEYTLSTCQLDFCLPSKFNLTYIDKDGQRKTPVVLHRAILGSLDRFMAYILEETKGNLPLWLAPVQATILPVKNEDEELNAYAHGLYDYLADNGIRVEIDERAEKLGYRVREAQVKKIPYLIVLGKNEAAEGTVSYRLHGEQKSTTVSKDEFVAMLKDEIATKKNNPAAAK